MNDYVIISSAEPLKGSRYKIGLPPVSSEIEMSEEVPTVITAKQITAERIICSARRMCNGN
jgi:hypothetical protein